MKSEEIVQKVGETVRLTDDKKRDSTLTLLIEEFRRNRVAFTPEQAEEMKLHAFQLLHTSHPDFVVYILEMILHGSDIEVRTRMEGWAHVLVDESELEIYDKRRARMFDLLYDIMQENGVVDQDETALYLDFIFLQFVDPFTSRDGYLILTNKRAIIFGRYIAVQVGRTTTYRLYYDDWKERPYLISFDFLDYDKILSIESEWKLRKKRIDLEYRTKYIKQKQQVFGGPLFFKFDFGKTMDLVDDKIILWVKPNPTLPERKKRMIETVRRLREIRESRITL